MTIADVPSLLSATLSGDMGGIPTIISIAVSSALAAFFGSYLKRRGEDKASKENFDAMREQLKKTTEDTESIKSALSNRSWLDQQHWTIREQRYAELLTQVTKLKAALEIRHGYGFPLPEGLDARPDSAEYSALVTETESAIRHLRDLQGPASIFVSPNAICALSDMQDHLVNIDKEIGIPESEYTRNAMTVVGAAWSVLLQEAQFGLLVHRYDKNVVDARGQFPKSVPWCSYLETVAFGMEHGGVRVTCEVSLAALCDIFGYVEDRRAVTADRHRSLIDTFEHNRDSIEKMARTVLPQRAPTGRCVLVPTDF